MCAGQSDVKHTVLVIQSGPTLCDPMDYSLPGSSVHGIFQAVDSYSLVQGIILTQGSNLSLLHCTQILYYMSHQGSHSPCSKDFQGRWSMYKMNEDAKWEMLQPMDNILGTGAQN